MRKIITFLFVLIAFISYGQTNNFTNTKFPNGLQAPNGATEVPATGLTAGALFYKTSTGLRYYDGSAWQTVGIAGSGLTGFTTFGSTPNANGGSISGQNIILQPASASFPGGVSTGTQTIAGNKTWTGDFFNTKQATSNGGTFIGSASGSVASPYMLALSERTLEGLRLSISPATNIDGSNFTDGLLLSLYKNTAGTQPMTAGNLFNINNNTDSKFSVNYAGNTTAAGTVKTTGLILSSITGVSGGTDSLLSKNATTNVVTKVPASYYAATSGNVATATALQNSRTLWGQSFNGTANVTGSLTSVGDITGGASNMIITAGTGNDRILTLQATGSSGIGQGNIALQTDGTTNFTNHAKILSGHSLQLVNSLGNSTLDAWNSGGTGASIFTTTSPIWSLSTLKGTGLILTNVSGVSGGTDSLLSKNATTNVITKIPAGYYAAAASYVPYTGATTDVDLGTNTLTATGTNEAGVVRGNATTGLGVYGTATSGNGTSGGATTGFAGAFVATGSGGQGLVVQATGGGANPVASFEGANSTTKISFTKLGSITLAQVPEEGADIDSVMVHASSGNVKRVGVSGTGNFAKVGSPTFTGTVTMPTPFTLGAVSVTTTGDKLNLLTSATGTTGTASTNVVYSASPTFTGTVNIATSGVGILSVVRDGSGTTTNGVTIKNLFNAINTGAALALSAASTGAPTALIYSVKTNSSGIGSGATGDLVFQSMNNALAEVGRFTSAGLLSSTGGVSTTTGVFSGAVTGLSLALGTTPSTFGAGSLMLPNDKPVSWRNQANDANLGFYLGADNIFTSEAPIKVGTNPATAGSYRLSNDTPISWRNAANDANFGLYLSSSNRFAMDAGLDLPLLLLENGGAAPTAGEVTLVVGTATVNTTAAVTGRPIFFQRRVSGGTIGFATTYTISSGTSFTISSDSALDTSTYAWWIVGTY